MTTAEKARAYDDLVRESDRIQRENSKLKSEYVTNIPPDVARVIKENERKIGVIVGRVEGLFR
jgi:hypothetical protein